MWPTFLYTRPLSDVGECDLQGRTEKHESKRARLEVGQVVLQALPLNHCVVDHWDDLLHGKSVSQKAHVFCT